MLSAVLVLNVGSSSVKFAVYAHTDWDDKKVAQPQMVCRGSITGANKSLSFSVSFSNNQNLVEQDDVLTGKEPSFETRLNYLIQWITNNLTDYNLIAIGHRIVHGGQRYPQSVCVTDTVMTDLEQLIALAPLHQPHNLAGIRLLQKLYPKLPHVACFDTSFHTTQPDVATCFALPKHLRDQSIRRYGFHGLSYRYIAEILPTVILEKKQNKVVVAHLGHGASMCALKDQKSIATTMGFTAVDGLPMGTRSGTIDPGVILYLLTEKKYTAPDIEKLLYQESGLLGLSGISCDMRDLLNHDSKAAMEAVDYFCYRVNRELGSLVAALGGVDTLIFTGGIGENAAPIRRKVCELAKWLPLILDEQKSDSFSPKSMGKISHPSNKVDVWVIPTNEEFVIAQDVFRLIG